MEKIESAIKIIREEKINGIIMRAKAKWQVDGEKSTQYFCNLEKKHYFSGPFLGSIFIIVVDAMSKWPQVIQMSKTTSRSCERSLQEIEYHHVL